MANEFNSELVQQLVHFIVEIGIDVVPITIGSKTFLPGILVEHGKIFVDEARLTYPGDLLHEAGHLAVAPGELRPTLSGEVAIPGVLMEPVESQAIAWSYAAILHLGLDPRVVFHEGGYGNGASSSESLLFSFSLGVYIGVNGLQDAGLTAMGHRATELGVTPYPHMLKWLRD